MCTVRLIVNGLPHIYIFCFTIEACIVINYLLVTPPKMVHHPQVENHCTKSTIQLNQADDLKILRNFLKGFDLMILRNFFKGF